MAEYVHKSLEDMLPELEEMNHLDLFSQQETKIILKKRQAFEYRLQQKQKTKSSFQNYITYEKSLLELLNCRRQRLGGKSEKKGIERSIVERIHSLYRSLNICFKEDLSLWEEHIEFSVSCGEKGYVSRLYQQALKMHSHREDLWVKSAQWERSQEGHFNAEMAREILLKGHRINPKSEAIFLEMYHMELELAEQVLERKSVLGIQPSKGKSEEKEAKAEGDAESERPTDELKVAEIVYKKGLDVFPNNAGFHVKMLNICSKYPRAKSQLANMDQDLRQLYPTNARVLNGLAMRHLTDFANRTDEKSKAIKDCLAVFKEAVEKIRTEEMWSYCLEGHLTILSLKPKKQAMILEETLGLFEKAVTQGKLSEKLFLRLIDLLNDLGLHEDASQACARGVEKHPGSARLWHSRLSHLVQAGATKGDLQGALREALRHVPAKESWDLWLFLLNSFSVDGGDALQDLMEGACRSLTPEVCLPAKVWSLHWTSRQRGIKKARIVYNSLKGMRPINLDFYRLYIHIENSQVDPNFQLMRAAFEEALAECGKTDTDVWLNYMEFETQIAKDAPKSGFIQQRALRALDPKWKESFMRKQTIAGLGM